MCTLRRGTGDWLQKGLEERAGEGTDGEPGQSLPLCGWVTRKKYKPLVSLRCSPLDGGLRSPFLSTGRGPGGPLWPAPGGATPSALTSSLPRPPLPHPCPSRETDMGRVGAQNAEPCVTSSLPVSTTQAPTVTRPSVRRGSTFRAPACHGRPACTTLTQATLLRGRVPAVREKGSGGQDRCCRGDTCPLPSSSSSGPSPPLPSASLQRHLSSQLCEAASRSLWRFGAWLHLGGAAPAGEAVGMGERPSQLQGGGGEQSGGPSPEAQGGSPGAPTDCNLASCRPGRGWGGWGRRGGEWHLG